jgi:hypothetical protein
MAKRVSMRHKRREAPEWVFSWRTRRESPFVKAFAILLVGGVFAVLLTSVRIRVAEPMAWAARKAAVIQVLDDAEGRALTLRASEEGPFPSRFEPSEWELTAELERVAYQAARWRPPPYVPALRELPDTPAPVLRASRVAPVLPQRQPPALAAPVPGKRMLAPVLLAFSGIKAEAMPGELPPFGGQVDPAMAAASWRFLLRLDAAGKVLDCVSLTGGDEAGLSALDAWLRRISFPAAPSSDPVRWIAVGVGFANQPADGTDAR